MRMLEQLKRHLDEMERRGDDRAHQFVEDLIIKQEEGKLGTLTRKQFEWLQSIHDRYVTYR